MLRPQGRLIIVDFAPHHLEQLRAEHAHRRLGFADEEVSAWCDEAGLEIQSVQTLKGDPLTVKIWIADKSEDLGDSRSADTAVPAREEAVT